MKALCAAVIIMLVVLIYFNLPARHFSKYGGDFDILVVEDEKWEPVGRVTPLAPPKCWTAQDRFKNVEVSISNGRCDLLLPGGGSLFYAGDPLLSRSQTEDGQEFQTF